MNLRKTPLLRILAATAIFSVAVVSQAAPVLFDFEDVAASTDINQNPLNPGLFSEIVMTSGGIEATLTRLNDTDDGEGGAFDIFDTTGVSEFPDSFGSRVLSPFNNETSLGRFRIVFSEPVFQFSIDFGDFGADDDSASATAYSGADESSLLVASSTAPYGTGSFPNDIGSLSLLSDQSFRSVYFIAGSTTFPNSAYYDNIRVDTAPVPEPAGLAALGFGALALARRRRRR